MWVSAHVAFKAFSGILTKEKVDQLAKKKAMKKEKRRHKYKTFPKLRGKYCVE